MGLFDWGGGKGIEERKGIGKEMEIEKDEHGDREKDRKGG